MTRKPAQREATLYGRDWRDIVASWDSAKRTQHQVEVARFVTAGWIREAAEYLAYELITKETEP